MTVTDPDQTVERTDTGVSITVQMTRGTGTRDQDKITAKLKAESLEAAEADLPRLREVMEDLAVDARGIQPDEEEPDDD